MGNDVAAIDQYCELLPSAEGPASSNEPRRGVRTVLPPEERKRLWQAGPVGRALLAMPIGVQAGAVGPVFRPLPGAAAALSGRLAEPDASGPGVLRATGTAAWDGGRLSQLFRWLLLASTIGLVGAAWARRPR
jgi:hypothetical protein